MSLSADHKTLLFLGAVAILGAGVRIARWSGDHAAVDGGQPGLARQMGAADSAARAMRRPKTRQKRSQSGRSASRDTPKDAVAGRTERTSPLGGDAPGYFLGKLDLDAASPAQIDSLPGIGPTLAKRIVADRAEHGPFVTIEGLRRVKGVGPSLLRRLDTVVTFSATLRHLSATPESVSARPAGRRRPKR